MPIFDSPVPTSSRVTRSASKRYSHVTKSVIDSPDIHRRSTRTVAIIESDSDSEIETNIYRNTKCKPLNNKDVTQNIKYNSSDSDSEDSNSYESIRKNKKRESVANNIRATPSRYNKSNTIENEERSYLKSIKVSSIQKIKKGFETCCDEIPSVETKVSVNLTFDDLPLLKEICNNSPDIQGKHLSNKVKNNCENIDDVETSILRVPNVTPRKKKSFSNGREYTSVTPPKQKRTNENVLFSPSGLLQQLDLNKSPTKKISEPKLERKKLFDDLDEYKNARRALHSTVPVEMPGREKEHSEMRSFIKHHLENKTSGTLYVSGPPGTGKTASLSTILQQPDIISEFKQVYVNCTAIKSAGSIYARILRELDLSYTGKSEKEYIAAIEKYLAKKHKMILLVLDEIDQLESKNQSVLYTIFEWPSWPDSKIVLVGIANALDLTDRILPRLQMSCALKPQLMHFAPYSKQQIVEIFTNRLKTAGVLHLFTPVALQMLAGKVAAVSGDVRRALDIGRRVIEIVDKHKNADVLKAIDNVDVQPDPSINKTVDLKHVMNVLNSVYGTSNSLSSESDDSFPLQQKIVVCTLLLILKKARNKDVTIGKLHEVYRKVCSKRNLLAIDQAEFVGLCQLIETKGIIRIFGKKEPRLHKVNLEWDEEEVSAALKDKQLMSTILQDDTCLGKM